MGRGVLGQQLVILRPGDQAGGDGDQQGDTNDDQQGDADDEIFEDGPYRTKTFANLVAAWSLDKLQVLLLVRRDGKWDAGEYLLHFSVELAQ